MREKTSDKAQDGMKDELRRAYDVLRHLKKKVGPHAFNEEYGIVMTEIRNALNMPHPEKRSKRRVVKAQPLKAVTEPVHIDSDDASADEEFEGKGQKKVASDEDEQDEVDAAAEAGVSGIQGGEQKVLATSENKS